MEGGKEQNFWPGFVDALSNVVLVMIFVVVVFVLTLFYFSQKLAQFRAIKFIEKKEVQEQVATPQKNQPDISRVDDGKNPDVARLKLESEAQTREIAQLKGQVALLQAQLTASSTVMPGSTESDAGAPVDAIQIERSRSSTERQESPGVVLDSQQQAVKLRFDKDGVQLDDAAIRSLDTNIGQWTDRTKADGGRIVVTGVVGTVSYSEGRRRAYYRTMAVRNYLIDKGLPSSSIVSRVVPSNESAESDATVLIQYAARTR